MSRSALALVALVAAGCNPSLAGDNTILWMDTVDLGDGRGVALMGGDVTVNAAVRDGLDTFRIKAGLGGAFSEDEGIPNATITMAAGLSVVASGSGVPTAGSNHAEAVWESPDFAACAGDGFEETSDGGCSLGLLITLESSRPASFTMTLTAKGWSETFDGDKKSLDIETDLVNADL